MSDIHGNWDALQAVLKSARGEYDEIVCCGDLVGYGASPKQVLEWASKAVAVIVRGNHDRACCGLDDLEWFNDHARYAAEWTMHEIGPDWQRYLTNLPQGPWFGEDFAVVHGSPRDEDEYLVNDSDAFLLDQVLMRPVTFFGHTHLQGGWLWSPEGASRLPKIGPYDGELEIELKPHSLYLVNPGSAGQPRDQDPRAAYVLYDAEKRKLWFRRVQYNIGSAQKRIRAAGLPDLLASRLALGR